MCVPARACGVCVCMWCVCVGARAPARLCGVYACGARVCVRACVRACVGSDEKAVD